MLIYVIDCMLNIIYCILAVITDDQSVIVNRLIVQDF